MTVYLVGAGPGDPGLLTIRGRELLESANVVVYERYVDIASVELAPPAAERVYVGTCEANENLTPAEINEMLCDLGSRFDTVVRLKGGDPFVFGYGPDEAAALADAGVPFEIVPGVSSATAAPAYAGIPITTGNSNASFTVVSAWVDPEEEPLVNWEAIAQTGGTIVILMGLEPITAIVERLLEAGMKPDTPAAVVHWGTLAYQATTRCDLNGLGSVAIENPSVVVIGSVVATELRWFEERPLFGRRIVVTRSRDQVKAMSSQFHELGAEAIEVPTISVAEPADGGAALREATKAIHDYDWLVVTSPNGARRTMECFVDARELAGVKVAAIGSATADALAESKLVADLISPTFVAEALLGALGDAPEGGGRILISRAAVARSVLPDGLRAARWDVDVVEAYRTVVPELSANQRSRLANADTITFTSSSTVTNFVGAFGADAVPATVACIGPITARTARDLGLSVSIEASVHTVDGLVDAIVANPLAEWPVVPVGDHLGVGEIRTLKGCLIPTLNYSNGARS